MHHPTLVNANIATTPPPIGGTLPTSDTSTLLRRTFIKSPDENGEQVHATIDRVEFTGKTTPDGKHDLFWFRAKVGEKTLKNVMMYNMMVEWCDCDLKKDDVVCIERIRLKV